MTEAGKKRVALVTGASSEVGEAIARRLLQDGLHVYAGAGRVDRMTDLRDSGAELLPLDVSDEESRLAAVVEINRHHDGVDILVNNEEVGIYGALEDVPLEAARKQFEVNLFGAARLTQLLVPFMREKRSGRIINITSMGGKIYTPMGSWYHASKHALEGVSDCLRLELAPFDIEVVVIEPGLIETSIGARAQSSMEKFSGEGSYAEMTELVARARERAGRGSRPEVIARVVSRAIRARKPRTRYVTGKHARLLLGVREWFGDRVYDRLIQRRLR